MASLYDISIPLFVRQMEQLTIILKTGEAWCEKNGVDKSKLLEGKLAEDMKPLTFQIQTCSNFAKNLIQRIGGGPETTFEDNEKTFPELYERIDKTLEILKAAKRSTFLAIDAPCPIKATSYEFNFKTTLQYLQNFAIPNFFFHMATAYDILRNAGVEIGKAEFLGGATLTESFEGGD